VGRQPVTATISPTSSASNFPITVPINSNGLGLFEANLQKVGSYTISVADSTGTLTGSAPLVTVTPAPAARMSFAAQPLGGPTGVTLAPVSVQILDLYGNVVTGDNTDVISLSVGSGPGPFTADSSTSATVVSGIASFSNLRLAVPGSYHFSAVLPGMFIASSTSFSVTPLQLVIGSLASTVSGFSVQFNAPLLVNSLTPRLYGSGFGAAAPVPTVTLTRTKDLFGHPVNDPISGSLLVDTSSNTLTFVATNTGLMANTGSPLLPDGGYTIDIYSGPGKSGLQALYPGGGFLDGLFTNVPGSGDYIDSFAVSTTPFPGKPKDDVLWVPATADGPGQALSAPGNNQVGGGYPIYLSDSTGSVTNASVTLNYDPTLLNVTGVSGPWFSMAPIAGGGMGLLYNGPPLPAGAQTPLGYLLATVPRGGAGSEAAPYKAKDLLHLGNPVLNFGVVPVVTSDALHVVAYVGDGDGNGNYTSNDAVLITRTALQADSGFAAYPLVDPIIVADTDGSGFIPADAALQVNEAGVGFPTANLPSPPIPSGIVIQAIANFVDPSVSIPEDLQVSADGTLRVPVNIDDADPEGSTGLIEAHLALTYNPSLFRVSAADVHQGSLLAGGAWSVLPTIDTASGQIAIALASSTPIASSMGGSLVTIDFHLAEGVRGERRGERPGASNSLTPDLRPLAAIRLVASVNINGQSIATELEDAQGTFILTPAPVNGFEPPIDGVVGVPATSLITTANPAAGEEDAARLVLSSQPNETAPETPALETTEVSAPTAPGLAEEKLLSSAAASQPGDTTLPSLHAGMITAAPSPLVLLGLAPLPGILSQVVSTAVPSVPGTFGLAASQRQSDQFFQALARTTAGDAVTPLLLSPPPAESREFMDADEVSLPWNASLPRLEGLLSRSRPVMPPAETPLQQPRAEKAALDQIFAQTLDDTDAVASDE
jgi:hypothetical protein